MSGIIQGILASVGAAAAPNIGDAYEGGYYAGEISTSANGVATHRLVVAPKSSGQSTKAWKTSNTSTTGTSSTIDGPSNSSAMNDSSHPAAQFCEGLTIGGYSDWYMPAKDELDVCYYNLKPTTNSNTTSNGTNNYSVPKRTTNYTTTVPGQTSATDFKSGGAQAFSEVRHWSSTQASSTEAWMQMFSNGPPGNTGTQFTDGKSGVEVVRAIRRVAI